MTRLINVNRARENVREGFQVKDILSDIAKEIRDVSLEGKEQLVVNLSKHRIFDIDRKINIVMRELMFAGYSVTLESPDYDPTGFDGAMRLLNGLYVLRISWKDEEVFLRKDGKYID